MDRRTGDRRQNTSSSADISIPSIGEIIGILMKRRLLITVLMFSPLIVGGVYLKTKPESYRAVATVMIENQQINLAAFQDILGDVKFDNLTVPTQVQVISSPTLAQETISSLNIKKDDKNNLYIDTNEAQPAEIDPSKISYELTQSFQGNLEVKQQGASRVIEIAFKSNDPATAAAIANAHTKRYVYSLIQQKKKQAEHIDAWIQKQIIQLKEEGLKKSKAVQKFRSETGMVMGPNSQDIVYQQISDIAAQITPIETKELDLKARMETLSGGNTTAISEIVTSDLIQSLKSQASEASQKLQSLRADLGEKHPQIIALRQEVDQINGDIAREIKNIKKSIEIELKTITKQKEMLQAKLDELKAQADKSQDYQITLQSLQVEESASSKLLDSFLARSEEIKSQIDFTRPDVRIVSLADVPNKPAGSKKTILLVLIAMFSAVFAIGTALLLELIDDGVHKKEDVRRLMHMKLLGCLPKEKNPIKNILDKKRTAFTEEIKRLYIHLSAQQDCKVIVFSSTAHDEGKSTTAISLAYYLNSIGKKTIIIDADTLSPTIAGITMLQEKPGLYELLSGTSSINDVIKQDINGLHIIPSGEKSSLVADLLLAGKFDKYLASLNVAYDYVLIDTSPALLAPDAEVLSRFADQVIIVSLWAKTPMKKIKQAGEILRQFSKTTPYVILNKLPAHLLKEK